MINLLKLAVKKEQCDTLLNHAMHHACRYNSSSAQICTTKLLTNEEVKLAVERKVVQQIMVNKIGRRAFGHSQEKGSNLMNMM